MGAGGGDVEYRAGFGRRDPQRQPARGEHRLDVTAMDSGPCRSTTVETSPFTLGSPRHRSARMSLPSRTTCGKPSSWPGPAPGACRAPRRQHCDDLVQVPVRGGPGDAVVTGQRPAGWCGRGTSAALGRPARSRSAPGCRAGCRPAPLGRQQPRGELRRFSGDVKRGTIGDHVEPSSRSRSCGETSSTGAPRPFPDGPRSSACLPDCGCLRRSSTEARAISLRSPHWTALYKENL